MKQPEISVIVPVYNAEKYLGRCIESVLRQTYKDFELILVNDGSKDSSLVICREYERADERIKVIDKPNGGVSSARNAGIDNACGKMLTFLDSDDYLSEDFLEAFGDFEDYDFCSQGSVNEYTDRPTRVNSHNMAGRYEKALFLESMYNTLLIASPWAKLYSAKIIQDNNLRFDERFSYAEDRIFNAACLIKCKRFSLSTGAGYHYTHENPSALTKKTLPADKLLEYVKAYRPMTLQLLSENSLSPKAVSIARHTYNYDLLQSMIQIAASKEKYNSKLKFFQSIGPEMKCDAASQRGLPPFYFLTSRSLRFPTRIALLVIILLARFKGIG